MTDNQADGAACVRVARELRAFLADDDGLDTETRESVLADLDRIERVGRWLYGTKPILLSELNQQRGFPTGTAPSQGTAAA